MDLCLQGSLAVGLTWVTASVLLLALLPASIVPSLRTLCIVRRCIKSKFFCLAFQGHLILAPMTFFNSLFPASTAHDARACFFMAKDPTLQSVDWTGSMACYELGRTVKSNGIRIS